jgi:mono/diheme cytochrome c family protein
MTRNRLPAVLAVALLVPGATLAGQQGVALAQRPAVATAAVTFTRDVAPILQQKCQVCHQPGSIAPMSLITYEEVRQFGALIKQRVEQRIMPPWHIDKDIGVQEFRNDRSLSDEQIATIAAWVEAGMPRGDVADMPAPAKWPDATQFTLAQQFGPPDLVIKSDPYDVQAHGQDVWWRPEVPTGLTEPRWLRAVQVKPSYPGGRKVTHHTLATLLQEENGITGLASTAAGSVNNAGLLTEWAIGKVGEIYPEDTGKLLLPGSKIRFEVHYSTMAGIEVPDDQVELALWFYPQGYTPKYRTILRIFNVSNANTLEIPPHTLTTHQSSFVLPAPTRLESFQPHMHMRGRAMSMEALYPDGRREVLSMVSNFQWKWHNNYIYAENSAPLLPKGTVLQFTVWHDNTANNPHNPDPDQYITWGDRTVDEMGHAWVGVTYLEQDDFDRLTAERKQKVAEQEEHRHPDGR